MEDEQHQGHSLLQIAHGSGRQHRWDTLRQHYSRVHRLDALHLRLHPLAVRRAGRVQSPGSALGPTSSHAGNSMNETPPATTITESLHAGGPAEETEPASSPPADSPRFNLWNEARFLFHVTRPREVSFERTGTSKHKHVVLLHGWHSTEVQMRAWHHALRDVDGDRSVWRITYDTHWKSFSRSARQVMAALRHQSVDWDDVVLIGYSMGGIVARQMIAYGFPARALVTLCSPHHGALSWSPLRFPILTDPGAGTLTQWSPSLHRLNENPRDKAARLKYHLMAITFRDKRGDHDHDGIVGRPSAAGVHLGEVASRMRLRFDYGKRAFFTDPHMLGMSPAAVPTMAERIKDLLRSGN